MSTTQGRQGRTQTRYHVDVLVYDHLLLLSATASSDMYQEDNAREEVQAFFEGQDFELPPDFWDEIPTEPGDCAGSYISSAGVAG